MGPGRGSGSWGGGTRSRTGDSRALSHPRKAPHMLMPLALKHTSEIPTLLPHRACPQGQHRQTAAPCRRALQQEGEAGEEGRATGRGGWGPALATPSSAAAWRRLAEAGRGQGAEAESHLTGEETEAGLAWPEPGTPSWRKGQPDGPSKAAGPHGPKQALPWGQPRAQTLWPPGSWESPSHPMSTSEEGAGPPGPGSPIDVLPGGGGIWEAGPSPRSDHAGQTGFGGCREWMTESMEEGMNGRIPRGLRDPLQMGWVPMASIRLPRGLTTYRGLGGALDHGWETQPRLGRGSHCQGAGVGGLVQACGYTAARGQSREEVDSGDAGKGRRPPGAGGS